MRRRFLLTGLFATAGLWPWPVLGQRAALAPVEVFKSASCDCCRAWVDHLRAAGFSVKVTNVDDTAEARKRLGMPDDFGSCHTASVGGYVLEGHVPAADAKRLLALRPSAIGLAVPGMPVGSPGMEVGTRRDPYQVFLIDRRGRPSVFASYPQG
ncbi:MAG TPA: DUF411 domain-containing protein [Thermoanaerobaculia bacterium]|nr:DUF411 domain-containing protein [Thermoanaerobaculia bacterium]